MLFLLQQEGGSTSHTAYLNVTGVWELGVTGHNVTVAVVDDGLEWDNPDLKANYNSEGSIDLNDHDNDPMPNEVNGKPIGLIPLDVYTTPLAYRTILVSQFTCYSLLLHSHAWMDHFKMDLWFRFTLI